MKTSKQGIEFIKKWESLHDGDLHKIGLQPKMCPAGIWTEGYGHTIRDNKGNFIKGWKNKDLAYNFMSINNNDNTKDKIEAEKLLINDLSIYEEIVLKKVSISLKQNEFDALVSHTYNTGGSSTLFRMINNGNIEYSNWWLNTYITADGIRLKGLEKRRGEELEMFLS